MATQELFEFGDHKLGHIDFVEEETCWMDTKNIDIWKDTTCTRLLSEGILLDTVDLKENKGKEKNNQLSLVGAKVLFQGVVCAQTRGKNGTYNPNA